MYNPAQQILITAVSDFRMVFRDTSLRTFLFLPLIIILVISGFVPYLVDRFPVVMDYVPYVLMATTLQTATMFGFIYCMVLIDEKDTGVNRVYGVLPISKSGMIIYRLLFPYLFSILFTFLVLAVQPFYQFTVTFMILLSMLTAIIGPIFVLLITNYSSNKMQGMTWYKGINGLINLPLLAFFIPEVYAPLFGWLPSHWVFQAMNQYILGKPFYLSLGIGLVISLLILAFFVRQFSRRHFR